MRDGWLERDGVRLHHVEWGDPSSPRPALLLLHGLSSNARYWERLARALPGRRIVALDQRSHGLSDRPATGYETAELVADAALAITSLEMERVVLAGHSWGATIALALAVSRPDLVGGLAFIDAGLTSMAGRMSREEALSMMEPDLPVYADLEEAAAAARRYLEDAWEDDLMPFVEAGLAAGPESSGLVSTLTAPVRRQILEAMFAGRPAELWPRVEGPVLIALAERSWEPFLTIKREGVARVRSLLPGVTVRWYDSPHDIPVVRPAELAADLEVLSRAVAVHPR